jgi:serine/threonine protein phosphatase PrpC
MQGYRVNMEDAHVIEEFTGINDHTLVGVFDGHAGKGTADYASLCLLETIENTKEWNSYLKLDEKRRNTPAGIELIQQALVFAYLSIDYELINADFYVNLLIGLFKQIDFFPEMAFPHSQLCFIFTLYDL